jgi:hypothetical protein
MYYHCRPIQYVKHGKVYPYEDPESWLLPAYRWLGHYCGYCPQIWLSRGDISMTCYRRRVTGKKTLRGWVADRRESMDLILFGYDTIKGFPIDYFCWCGFILGTVIARPNASVDEINARWAKFLIDAVRGMEQENDPTSEAARCAYLQAWSKYRDIDAFLKNHVFVERGQVVTPSLNLKAAKIVICRDERPKKALRRMGFIEDRIQIRNMLL